MSSASASTPRRSSASPPRRSFSIATPEESSSPGIFQGAPASIPGDAPDERSSAFAAAPGLDISACFYETTADGPAPLFAAAPGLDTSACSQEFSFSFYYLEGFCDHALYDFRQDSLMAEIMIQRYRMGRTDAISALEEFQAAKEAAQRRAFYESANLEVSRLP